MDKTTNGILGYITESIKRERERLLNTKEYGPQDDEAHFVWGKLAAYEEILKIIEDDREEAV